MLFMSFSSLSIPAGATTLDEPNWAACTTLTRNIWGHVYTCAIPKDEPQSIYTVKYESANGNAMFHMVSAPKPVSAYCNGFQGDPDAGAEKTCAYTDSNIFGVKLASTLVDGWEACSQSPCDTNQDKKSYFLRWVAYGGGGNGNWLYGLVGGDEALSCNAKTFIRNSKLDMFIDVKPEWLLYSGSVLPTKCLLGPEFKVRYQTVPKWQDCASDGGLCSFREGSTLAVIRYGYGKKWTYRLVVQEKLPCGLTTFGVDPAPGVPKGCQYIPIGYPQAETVAKWERSYSCGGDGCTKLTYSIQRGTKETRTKATSSSWSNTTTLSIANKGGISLLGTGTTVSVSDSLTFAGSSTYTDALEKSTIVTETVSCGEPGDGGVFLYEFKINTSAQCQGNVLCETETYTGDYFCVTEKGKPKKYNGPKCLPDMCADLYCQTCR